MDETRPVVLFRAWRAGDPYERCLKAVNMQPRYISVLDFEPINDEALDDALRNPENYSGMVITSERAATRVIERIGPYVDGWRFLPLYAIGPRTAQVLDEAGLTPTRPAPGNAEALADHIIRVHADDRPLLFPCSSRRRDTLPDKLEEGGDQVSEVHVYETHEHPPPGLDREDEPAWVVFFSPSGVDAIGQEVRDVWPGALRAAIGETTSGAMAEAGLPAHAVAESPDPDSLVAAIVRAEKAIPK